MFNVLLIDRSNGEFIGLARHLAKCVDAHTTKILFLSAKEPSEVGDNFEVVNIRDIPQSLSISELQRRFPFSLLKILVPERSFFDYSSFRRSQRYSNLEIGDIYSLVAPYLNALDFLIRERADMVVEGLADNFVTSAAGQIARFYRKRFYMAFMYYWWKNALLFVDRLDQTSSVIEERYAFHRKNISALDKAALLERFERQTLGLSFVGKYTLRARIVQLLNRRHSYEPFSIKNWLARRISWQWSKFLIRARIRFEKVARPEKFLLFPLHVAPEATLLGSVPELADQFSLIKNISMNLPADVILYVKEHPHQQIGLGLDYAFYRRLLSLPNVRLFSARVRAEALYADHNCLAVVVIAGTVGLEAAIRRVPVIVFGRAIYQCGECFLKPKDFEEFFAIVKQLTESKIAFDEDAMFSTLQALQDSATFADVDFSKARNWSELAYLVNMNIAELIRGEIARQSRLTP